MRKPVLLLLILAWVTPAAATTPADRPWCAARLTMSLDPREYVRRRMRLDEPYLRALAARANEPVADGQHPRSLHLTNDAPGWLSFLATAVERDELAIVLKDLGVAKARLHLFLPTASAPVIIDITPDRVGGGVHLTGADASPTTLPAGTDAARLMDHLFEMVDQDLALPKVAPWLSGRVPSAARPISRELATLLLRRAGYVFAPARPGSLVLRPGLRRGPRGR